MKAPMLLLLLTPAFVAGPASAQVNSDQESVAINGTVSGLCILGAPSRASVDLGTLIATSGSRVGRIKTIGAQQISLPGSFCNFAGTALSISADAMRTPGTVGSEPGFARAINYTSTVGNWAAQDATVTTAATANGGTPETNGSGGYQPLPKIADLDLTLSSFTVPGDSLLVAGDYEGSVTITLGPAIAAD